MSNLLPAIEELSDCQTHYDRAKWLLECPLSILLTYSTTIRNRLHLAGFQAGLEYLEAEISCSRAMRRNGMAVVDNPLRCDMQALAKGWAELDPPAADPATTEL